jgi:type II secretory pathway pseudopilin PulG
MNLRARHFHPQSAFTMVEVAISLAIISFALIGIIGVLPLGLHTQRDNREATIIAQDATVFIEDISKGARADDLTNYVYAITNYWTSYDSNGLPQNTNIDGYSAAGSHITRFAPAPVLAITNGFRIVGLLSTPEYINASGSPLANVLTGGISNHIIAYVRSISGSAAEKPPQNNDIMVGDSFGYRIYCVNAPTTSAGANPALLSNLHELRLTFLWPQLPNGNLGGNHQTFRASIGGDILLTNDLNQYLYFYQPQSFIGAP